MAHLVILQEILVRASFAFSSDPNGADVHRLVPVLWLVVKTNSSMGAPQEICKPLALLVIAKVHDEIRTPHRRTNNDLSAEEDALLRGVSNSLNDDPAAVSH
jgi:hypothetical protein